MARSRDILCPYCFTRWRTNVAAFRCTSRDASRCKLVPDEALGRLRSTVAPLSSRVVVKQGRFGQEFTVKPGQPVRCECCGEPTKPVCPTCHSDLPQRFTETASQSMALIGTKAAGKSHFIAVTLHELEHKVGPSFGGNLMLLDDWTRDRVEHELLPHLYGSGVVLAPTTTARSNGDLRRPLVSRLTLGRAGAARSSNLVFFDAAGEDLSSLDVLEREARYITQSDGLILLLDPLQIAAVRDELTGTVALPPIVEDPATMLGRVANLLREARAIPVKRQIDMPIGLAVSKVDVLRPLLSDTHPVFSLPAHDGRFDPTLARTISETLRSDLADWIGERFDNLVRAEFSRHSYFGLSALGENPVDGKIRNGIAPLRVEDPVLWMLDAWKALPR